MNNKFLVSEVRHVSDRNNSVLYIKKQSVLCLLFLLVDDYILIY